MNRYSKEHVSLELINAGMIPVFYHEDIEICKNVIGACYKGGVRVFEYTDRGVAAIKNFPFLLKYIRDNFADMLFGIGSVFKADQALRYIEMGADFIVSPVLDEDTGRLCGEKDKYWIPGCGTLSEIYRAETAGAEIIKIFPGNMLGPGFINAVKGPMPWLKLMPTGGVEPTEDNLNEWYKAGAVCVGMGSRLISGDVLREPELLEDKVRKVYEIINKIKLSLQDMKNEQIKNR